MKKCENCGDYAPTTLGLCKLCQIAEREDERRIYHMKNLKPLKGDINKPQNTLSAPAAPVVQKIVAKSHNISKKSLRRQKWVE